MQCVILAGGLGTRMRPRTDTIPKTLLPVGGRPFATWQLEWLAAAGTTSVVYCTGHRGEQVEDFVRSRSWGMEIEFSPDGPEPRGTAGALLHASRRGLLDELFLVVYGDSWLQVDPADVHEAALATASPGLMTVFENNGLWDRSNVVLRDDRVVRYDKDPTRASPDMRWIDYGLSAFRRTVIDERVPESQAPDLAPLLSALAEEGSLAGFLVQERFFEIGSPAGLDDLEQHLARRPTAG